jgi:hypothetical protein
VQSEKAKRAGNTPSTVTVAEYLSRNKVAPDGDVLWEPLVLEEESHMNARAATLSVSVRDFHSHKQSEEFICQCVCLSRCIGEQ